MRDFVQAAPSSSSAAGLDGNVLPQARFMNCYLLFPLLSCAAPF